MRIRHFFDIPKSKTSVRGASVLFHLILGYVNFINTGIVEHLTFGEFPISGVKCKVNAHINIGIYDANICFLIFLI